MLATAAPKPLAKFRAEKFTKEWWATLRKQQREAKDRAIAKQRAKPRQMRKSLPRSTKPLPQVNAKRQARKSKDYNRHIGSAYWKDLRQQAYKRDGGLCQCPDCIQGRKDGEAAAFEPIAIWFDVKGGIHGFDTHHTTYARFGAELLSDVLTMWPAHHRRLEAKTGMRKAFLKSK